MEKKRTGEQPFAKIELFLYQTKVHFVCNDTRDDILIDRYDGDSLLEAIENVDIVCDPETRFVLSEKGMKLLAELKEKGNI